MSMRPDNDMRIPEDTVKIAHSAFPKGNRYFEIRRALGTIYRDEQFADLFPTNGQPALAPWRLAIISVVQFWEDLTDRQAADAVRSRIDLKYLLGLPLDDAGFHHTVLSGFRQRVTTGEAEERLLDAVLDALQEGGWLKAGGTQRTDATHVLSAVSNLNRLRLVGETMYHTLDVLAQVAPEWLRRWAPMEWYERYGRPYSDFRLPRSKEKRRKLFQQIGRDGYELLDALDATEKRAYLREVPAVKVLRQIWEQQFSRKNGQITRRTAKNMPKAAELITSPYETEARSGKKGAQHWRGYKVHLTETVTPNAPQFVVNVTTTHAAQHDSTVVDGVHDALAKKGLLPQEHLVDAGYVSADNLVKARKKHKVALVGPAPRGNSWQARTEGGLDQSRFFIDWEAQVVTCPNGAQSRKWTSTTSSSGQPLNRVAFDPKTCLTCHDRPLCTRSKNGPRQLAFPMREQHEALRAAEAYEKTDAFKKQYAQRAGVEGTISQAVQSMDMRRSRYRGQHKTHLQHIMSAIAINLQRLASWLSGDKRSKTRVSHFGRLATIC